MFSGVSLDQAPPIRIPLFFMLAAPIFGVLASIFIILFADKDSVRYSDEIVVIAHLFFIGFAGFVMIGAIFQMLPVVVGVRFIFQNYIAKITFSSLVVGLLLFTAKFMVGGGVFFGYGAVIFLYGGFLVFGIFMLASIAKKAFTSPSALAMTLAVLFLMFGVTFGAHLLFSNTSENIGAHYFSIVSVHIFTLFLGWVLTLIIGISFQVVPMFWVTKAYAPFCRKAVIPFMALLVVFFPAILFFGGEIPSKIWIALGMMPALAFAFATLIKLHQRKRKIFDIVVLCWQMAMVFLIFCVLAYIVSLFMPLYDFSIVFGILFGFGFVSTVIVGMLYKIVPFLTWFHISSRGIFDVPMMGEMVDETVQRIGIAAHFCAVVALCCGYFVGVDYLITAGGVLLFCSFLLLFVNLLKIFAIYRGYENDRF